MRLRRRYLPEQMQKDRRRALIGRNRRSKRDVAQELQSIGDADIAEIPGLPKSIALGELRWAKGGEAEEIVAAVLDHVDPEVVAGQDLEVRSNAVACRQPLQFPHAVKAGVLHTDDLRNPQHPLEDLVRPDLPIRREHPAQLKAK